MALGTWREDSEENREFQKQTVEKARENARALQIRLEGTDRGNAPSSTLGNLGILGVSGALATSSEETI